MYPSICGGIGVRGDKGESGGVLNSWAGVWDPDALYEAGDLVLYEGSVYVLVPEPTAFRYASLPKPPLSPWQLFVQRGLDGDGVRHGASLNLSSDFQHMADNQFDLEDAGFLNGTEIVDGSSLRVLVNGLWSFAGVLNISSASEEAYPLEGDVWAEWDATSSLYFTERVPFYAHAGGDEPPAHQSFTFTIPLKAQDTVRVKFKLFARDDDIQLSAGGVLLASQVMQEGAA